MFLPLRAVVALAKKMLTAVTHISLSTDAKIGPGVLIPHVGPIYIHPGVIIGADFAIHQVCTIGASGKPGLPVLGDHVLLGRTAACWAR